VASARPCANYSNVGNMNLSQGFLWTSDICIYTLYMTVLTISKNIIVLRTLKLNSGKDATLGAEKRGHPIFTLLLKYGGLRVLCTRVLYIQARQCAMVPGLTIPRV